MTGSAKYLGKYRGTVVNNVDPQQIGRIQVLVPDVSGVAPTSWAMPCMPYGGINAGMFTVPAIGTGVWVEFEQGDPDYPIWVGTYWGSSAEMPKLAQTAPSPTPAVTIQTPLNNGIVIADALGPTGVGGITLKSASGATIAVNDIGITIDNGKGASITLTGPTVDINLGALTVT
ncbi:MAG: baseplate assembly protein [Halieaceae bacterium]|nr:baseplate assembly protein [Halieaceae bacterium]